MDRHAPRGQGGKHPPAGSSAPGVDAAEFADYLRAERERRQLTLDQIADETKIASRHLAALERGDVRNWPGGMYRRAMMRAYAESIGVDREYALQQFEQAFDAKREPPEAPLMPPAPAPPLSYRLSSRLPYRRLSRRHIVAATAVLLFVLAGAGIWKAASSLVGKGQEARDTPEAAPAAAVATPAVTPPASTSPGTPAVARREAATTTNAVATTGSQAIERRVLATEGSLVVASTPPGARVTINGIGWGATPVTVRNLEFGSKRIRLTLQGFHSQERVIHLAPDNPSGSVRLTLREREQARVEASR